MLVADVLDDEGLVHEQLLADLGAPLLLADLHDLRLDPLLQMLLHLPAESDIILDCVGLRVKAEMLKPIGTDMP